MFITIFRIIVKGKKHYIQPSINSLIELLATHHDIHIHRCWAFRCEKALIDTGYITRQERWKPDGSGGQIQVPGLISITLKGARKLYSLGVAGAEELCKKILGWVKEGDKRWPDYRKGLNLLPGEFVAEGIKSIREIIASLEIKTPCGVSA